MIGGLATGRLATLDRDVFDAVARSDTRWLDTPMRRLTRAADRSVLWAVVALALMASGRTSARRAAWRGMSGVAVSSLLTNQVGKRVWRRRRPDTDLVPPARAVATPRSASMPSGHSASAAAFVVGVAVENPGLGIAIAPLAVLVGISRVATGAHYPADVVVGWAVGVAVSTALRRAVPPMRVSRSPRHSPAWADDVVPSSDGAGVVLVVNPAAGSGEGRRIVGAVERGLPAAEVVLCDEGDDIAAVLDAAAARARVLAVGGGDGTVATAASVAADRGIPLAVFPAGTFNHFAKDIGCPEVDDTIAAISAGRAAWVDVGRLNDDRAFVNTASIGAYPHFVRYRERHERRVGKPAATALAMLHTLRREPTVRVIHEGRVIRTPLVFVGSSVFETPGFAPVHRPRLDDGLLDIRILDGGGQWATTRIMLALVSGRLRSSPLYHELRRPSFTISTVDGPTSVALDGEIAQPCEVASFRVDHRAVRVYGRFRRD